MKLQRFCFTHWMFIAAICSAAAQNLNAASHTWSGAVNGLFSNAGNWSSGGVPTLAETNSLVFPSGATRTIVTNDIGALKVSAFNFSGSNYVVRGTSAFSIQPSLINILCNNSNTIESPLNFASSIVVAPGLNDSLVLAGSLTGAGGLVKFGDGDLYLRGSGNNTFSGGLTVSYGKVYLGKTGGATALPGPVIVGSTNMTNLCFVSWEGSDQISGAADITVNPAGGLFMNGHTNLVDSLTMWSGALQTYWGLSPSPGLMRISTGLTLAPWLQTFPLPDVSPIVRGQLEFVGASSSIYVSNANVTCEIEADIMEFSGVTVINKTGPGTLWLKGGGNNPGAINVLEGGLRAEQNTSLGTAVGNTTVATNATLTFGAGIITSESLVLSNNSTLAIASGVVTSFGNIAINGQVDVNVPTVGNQFLVNGIISGAGSLKKIGDGELMLTGNTTNTFTGATTVAKGRINLNKPANLRAIGSVTVTNGAELKLSANELIDNAATVSIYSGGLFNMTNRNETIGGLNIGGLNTIDTGTGTLALSGDVFVGTPYSTNYNGAATIRGKVSLGGGTRMIRTPGGYSMVLDCNISDGAGVGGLQIGDPNLFETANVELLRSNSFTGPVFLGGSLSVSNNFALGAAGGGVIESSSSGGNLRFLAPDMSIAGETLWVTNGITLFANSSGTWNGPIVMTNNATFTGWPLSNSVLTCNGQISGAGNVELYNFTGSGTMRLTQSNSYSGYTSVNSLNKLIVQHPHALGDTTQGTYLSETARLQLELSNGAQIVGESLSAGNAFASENAFLTVIGSVSNTWSGPVTNKCPALVVDVPSNAAFKFDGTINGVGGITKTNSGTLILGGTDANTHGGDTMVMDGIVILNKPNGVQAVSNLTVTFPGRLEWGGSEQIADAATLTLDNTYGLMSNYNETITHLAMRNGDPTLGATTGALTLLGNIDVTGAIAGLNTTTVLGSGIHQINGFPFGALLATKSIHETGGSAGLAISDSDVVLEGSNTFSGPVSVVNDSHLTVRHPSALGSTAQGVATTNWGVIVLDLPQGGIMDPEPLTLGSGTNDLAFIYLTENKTNTWTGPVTLNGRNILFAGQSQARMIINSTMSGPGSVEANGVGTVVLAGSAPNIFNGLKVSQSGAVRLAKPPGVPALGGDIIIDEPNNHSARLVLDAANQFAPETVVSVGAIGTFDLNGQQATVRRLMGTGTVNIGAGTLTISNSLAEFGDFSGNMQGTGGGTNLIKQGTSQQNHGTLALEGGMSIQGGIATLAGGTTGAMNINAGALLDLYGPAYFGSLAGGGNIDSSSSPIRVGHNNANTIYSGNIFGGGATNLVKVGTGTLNIIGTNTFPGMTVVENGTLLVNGALAGSVLVKRAMAGTIATLGGTGQVQNVTLDGAGAWLSPGATTTAPGFGRFNLNNFTMTSGSRYVCEIGGTNAGVNLDQINASGTVTLAGGHAEFVAFNLGAVSNQYAVVKSPFTISGTFLNDPEGDFISAGAGRVMQITYLLAGGKEVTLIEQAGAPPANIQISGISQQPNGNITLTGTGTIGATYVIEANTNLNTTNWVNIGTVLPNFNGQISFTDTNTPTIPQCFYRFRLQ